MRGGPAFIPYHCPRCGSETAKFSTLAALRRHVDDVHLKENVAAGRSQHASENTERFIGTGLSSPGAFKEHRNDPPPKFTRSDVLLKHQEHSNALSQSQRLYEVSHVIGQNMKYQTPFINPEGNSSRVGLFDFKNKQPQSVHYQTPANRKELYHTSPVYSLNAHQAGLRDTRPYSSSARGNVLSESTSNAEVEKVLQQSRAQLDVLRRSTDRTTVSQNEEVRPTYMYEHEYHTICDLTYMWIY